MNAKTGKIVIALLMLGVILFFAIFGPIFTIWSLNTLFSLEIPMNFKTWCAVIWLMTLIHGIKINFRKTD